MSPQAWPLPTTLSNIITGGMKTSFMRSESGGPAGTSKQGDSSSTSKKMQANAQAQPDQGQASQKETGQNAPVDSSDRNSTCSTMSDVTTLAAVDIVRETKESLDHLGESFGSLAEQLTKLAQLGEELRTAEIINRLNKMMDIQDDKLKEDMRGIRALQEEVLKKDVIEHLKAFIGENVSDLIDKLVQEQVKVVLQAEHLRPELLTELRRHEQELSEVERELHNSESRRANAQIETAHLQRRLHTIFKGDGTVGLHFPENLHALLSMDGEVAKSLMCEYGLDNPSDSRDRNINSLMQFVGLSYQLVPTAGGSILAKISSSRMHA